MRITLFFNNLAISTDFFLLELISILGKTENTAVIIKKM